MFPEERWQSCRSLLYEPSEQNWEQLYSLLMRWPSEDRQELLLSYIEQHMKHWPQESPNRSASGWPLPLRVAPVEWKKKALSGHKPPFGWSLVRFLQYHYEGETLGDQPLIAMLEKGWLQSLTHLYLTGCQLRGDFLSEVVASQGMPSLTHLVLYGNQLDTRTLCDFLDSSCCETLQYLDLGACNLHDPVAFAIAESSSLRQLKTLMLSYNYLGMEGVYALANTNNLPSLTLLNLQSQTTSVSQGPLFRQGAPHLHKACFAGSLYQLRMRELQALCVRQGLETAVGVGSRTRQELETILLEDWKH